MREYTGSWNYTETRYLWCGERICQARDSSDTPIRRYYDEGEQLVTSSGITSYYYAQDHLGSVRDLVTASGTVLASYDYDPYGNPTRATSTNGARADYRYAGLFYHAQSGLYLTHYRVYDPVTARWLSRDPIGETGGINLYGYVGGSPISQADPLGLDAEAVMAALPAAVAVAMADSPIPGPADVAVGVALAALAVMPGDTTRPESTDQTCPVPASNSSDKWTCQGYANYEIIGQNKHVVRGAWIVAYGKTEQIAAKNWKKLLRRLRHLDTRQGISDPDAGK